MELYELHTNKVWEGFVGYRHDKVMEAMRQDMELLCYTDDRPQEYMIIPGAIIKKRILRQKYVSDKTGAKVLLDYFWWTSEQEKAKKKVEQRKQMKLI